MCSNKVAALALSWIRFETQGNSYLVRLSAPGRCSAIEHAINHVTLETVGFSPRCNGFAAFAELGFYFLRGLWWLLSLARLGDS